MSKRPAAKAARATAGKAPAGREPASPPAIPPTLRAAAAVQALEAAGMVVATVFSAAATVNGKSYQTGSGVALTLIALATALALALLARGLARAQPWSRTPAAMIQVFAIIAGVILLDGHRPDWGVPTLILAAAGLVTLFVPASFKALNRERQL